MSIDGTSPSFRKVWEGDTKIVIGVDIGPTQSGIAFTFLEKGANQVIHRVTRWPGQEGRDQQSRIPTLIWVPKAVAFGAEAQLYTVEEEAEDNGWVLAKHFKLHLHPIDMQARHWIRLDRKLSLPPGVTLRQIYSDFLGYLLKHTKEFFESRIIDGKTVWQKHSPTMEVVIAHPNGWGVREQAFLRSAAVDAGFSTADKASAKIRLGQTLQCAMPEVLRSILPYIRLFPPLPFLSLREKRPSACVQAGAIFVDCEAEKFLRRTLTGAGFSSYEVDEYTRTGVRDFEGSIKRVFNDETTEGWIYIGNLRFSNTAIRVRRGRMSLPGSTIKGFFDVCVNEIISSVDEQLSNLIVPHILLVGGFGDSPYLRREFQKRYEPQGCRVTSTNDSSSKAVADGAVIWAVTHVPLNRVPRLSWGFDTSVVFDPSDPDHLERQALVTPSARKIVPGRWKCLVKRGIMLDDKHLITKIPFSLELSLSSAELGEFKFDLYSYSGDDEPAWMRDKQGDP
ncbi:hypothetical protein OPQ81_011642 [Rhizoctonia solani]|nr:hypothetical protein OPQ81_011642 [Rhizoctonia solani]